MTRTRLLLVAFGLLQVADVLTTRAVLARGGFEGNPAMAWAIDTFDGWWWLPKFALMAACMALMLRWGPRPVAWFVGLMAVVIINNVFWAFA